PKGLDPRGSEVVAIRIGQGQAQVLDQLAKRHGRSRSEEMRQAFDFWTGFSRKGHTAELAYLIKLLVDDIERRTHKRWHRDALTGVYVRKLVERLIYHFAPAVDSAKEPDVPPEISEALSLLILRYEHHHHKFVGDSELEMLHELGSGFQRNRKVWLKRKPRGGL